MSPISKGFDLVGPTADDDMRRLIRRYGEDAARTALKRQTARRLGRPHEKDWQLIADIVRQDALAWLNGCDPFKARTSASIARDLAHRHQGQSYDSTVKRIKHKLARSRRYVTFSEAAMLAHRDFPYPDYMRAVEALIANGKHLDLWEMQRARALDSVAEFTIKYGAPSPAASMKQIEIEVAQPLPARPTPERRNVLQVLVGLPRK